MSDTPMSDAEEALMEVVVKGPHWFACQIFDPKTRGLPCDCDHAAAVRAAGRRWVLAELRAIYDKTEPVGHDNYIEPYYVIERIKELESQDGS